MESTPAKKNTVLYAARGLTCGRTRTCTLCGSKQQSWKAGSTCASVGTLAARLDSHETIATEARQPPSTQTSLKDRQGVTPQGKKHTKQPYTTRHNADAPCANNNVGDLYRHPAFLFFPTLPLPLPPGQNQPLACERAPKGNKTSTAATTNSSNTKPSYTTYHTR